MSEKIRAIVKIGGETLLLPDGVTEGDLLTVVKLCGRAKRVDYKWTPDYAEQHLVILSQQRQYPFGLELATQDIVCTEAEFEALSAAHPKEEDKKNGNTTA